MVLIHPNKDPCQYFRNPTITNQKRYEALRSFFYEKKSADEVASKFGYKLSTFYSMTRDFRNFLKTPDNEDMFFPTLKAGRKERDLGGEINPLIISLIKQYRSIPDIKAILDSITYKVSEKYIWQVLKIQLNTMF